MGSSDRFYQLATRDRSILHGDIGSLVKISGLIVEGGGEMAMLLLPATSLTEPKDFPLNIIKLTLEEWDEYIKRSDDPEILVSGSPEKVFHRKVRYEISGHVQQKVWVADGSQCVYCNQGMGKVQLTIDHFIPLELGGVNNVTNYLSACRRCNKDKGSTHPSDWSKTADRVETLKEYLRLRVIA